MNTTTTKQKTDRIGRIANKDKKVVFQSNNTYKAYAVYNKYYSKGGYTYTES